MDREDLFATCSAILSEVLKVPPEGIRPESRLGEDLGGDSLDLLRTVARIEQRFKLRLTMRDIEGLQTVGDVIDRLGRILAQRGQG